ncbi:MAG: FliM/FliN family flagellar motor switch protein [Armatimonadia bacterium]
MVAEKLPVLGSNEHELGSLSEAPLQVTVRLGTVQVPLGELLKVRAGSVLVLDRQVGEPAEIMVGDRVVALGQVVMVEDQLGVRVTEVAGR